MKLLKRLFIIIVFVVLSASVLVISKGYSKYKEALINEPLEDVVKQIQSKKNYTKFENLPKTYINAVIAVEDHRFYDHKGIDIIGIGRAIITDIRKKDLVEGGSSITQQLAKNLYFSLNKDLDRKIAETFMAWKLEKNYSKEEIFELYVNTSYFGSGYYTIKDASLGYFKKEPIKMNAYECTMIAGIPNAPSVYAPNKNLDLAKQRQRQVINKMVKYNHLTKEEAEKILKTN